MRFTDWHFMLFPCEPFEKFFNPLSRGAVAGSCELRKIFGYGPIVLSSRLGGPCNPVLLLEPVHASPLSGLVDGPGEFRGLVASQFS